MHGLVRRASTFSTDRIDHLYLDPHVESGRLHLHYGDLTDSNSLGRLAQDVRPDEVYNLAAQSVPADSWDNPIVTGEITALGSLRMLETVRRHRPEARFYQATSREIFGGVEQEVVDESTPFRANNPYGTAKLYAHLMTATYRESFDLFACGGILFNHESPRRSLHFVTRKVTMAAACIKRGVRNPPLNEAGDPLVVDGVVKLGNLDAVRDWGHAREYVDAMWRMLQQDSPRDYVIGTNTAYTIRDLCRVAFEHVDLDWQQHVASDERFMRPTEIAASRGDYAKAKAELGWEPRIGFEELVREMVDADLARVS